MMIHKDQTNMRGLSRPLRAAAFAIGLTGAASALGASSGTGSAMGISADLELLPLIGSPVTATILPTPTASGTAPVDFDDSASAVSVSAAIAGAATVNTGVLNAATQSSLGANDVNSEASVDNLAIGVGPLLLAGPDVLSLSATAIESTAVASCSGSTVQVAGSSTLTGLAVNVLGLGVGVSATPAPNTQVAAGVLGVLGLSIILNEQIATGDSMTVNAIHIETSGGLLGLLAGVLDADIIVAQSQVTMPNCDLPDLAITMTGPASATVGTAFDYTITLDNVGTAPTIAGPSSISVTDTIPAGLTIDSITAGPDCSCSNTGQDVTCTRDTSIAAGASGENIAVITVLPTTAGPASNTATVAGGGDNSPGNNTSLPVATAISNGSVGPNLQVNLSAPATIIAGQTMDYVVTLDNVGSAPTSGTITVTNPLPAVVDIVAVNAGANFSCNAVSPVVCTSAAAIADGSSDVPAVTIQVLATTPGNLSHVASVSGGGDVNGSDNDSAPANTTVQAASTPGGGSGSSTQPVPTLPLSGLVLLALAMIGLAGQGTGRRTRR